VTDFWHASTPEHLHGLAAPLACTRIIARHACDLGVQGSASDDQDTYAPARALVIGNTTDRRVTDKEDIATACTNPTVARSSSIILIPDEFALRLIVHPSSAFCFTAKITFNEQTKSIIAWPCTQWRIQWGCHGCLGTPSKNTNPLLATKICTNYA
jgi:hypothetical protein